jgi:hypothetical protein
MIGERAMAWIFAAIAVIAVLGLLVVTLSKPNTERQQEQHQCQPAMQDGAQPLILADSQSQPKCEAGDNKQRNYWERFVYYVETRDKFFTAFGTLIIAGFTVCLAFATIFLYFATRELVEGADKTAEKQLRAYVSLQSMEATIYPFEQGGYVVFAHTEARNFGQTPAYGMTIQANATVDVPTAIPFDDSQGNAKSAGAMTAFKDVGFQISQTQKITAEDAQAIRDQKKIIFFWGAIKYRDAFGRDHTFRFRLISNALTIGSTSVWSMVAHPLGFEDDD